MADMQETMNGALEELKNNARVEQADSIRGSVKIINRDNIRELIERFVNDFGTDAEKVAKITELEAELNALKEKLQSLGSDKDGLDGDLSNLNAQLAALQAEKDDVAQKLATLEAGDAFMRMKAVEAERDQLITEKEEAIAELARMQSMLEEKISKLEEIISASDLQQRVKDLEYELIDLKEAYRQAILGLEFIELVEEVDFAKAIDDSNSLLGLIAKVEASLPEDKRPGLETVKTRATFIQAQIKGDSQSYAKLVEIMNDNKGTIRVVVDIIRIALRDQGFVHEIEVASAALGLV